MCSAQKPPPNSCGIIFSLCSFMYFGTAYIHLCCTFCCHVVLVCHVKYYSFTNVLCPFLLSVLVTHRMLWGDVVPCGYQLLLAPLLPLWGSSVSLPLLEATVLYLAFATTAADFAVSSTTAKHLTASGLSTTVVPLCLFLCLWLWEKLISPICCATVTQSYVTHSCQLW